MTLLKSQKTTKSRTAENTGSRSPLTGERKESDLIGSQLNRLSDQRLTPARKANLKIKQDDLIMFTTQLSVMLDSGVVLSDALDAITEQSQQVVFKSIVSEIAESVKGGESFSKALAAYPKIFNPMFLSVIRASEASGRTAEMLEVLSSYINFEYETRKKIKGALTYPIIMVTVATVAISVLMFLVLPRFTKIYEAKGTALPKLTQILVGFSSLVTNAESMTVILTTLIAIGWGGYYWIGTQSGQRSIDYLKIHIPVLGTMFIDMVITRSMRIMATMLNTGVSLLDSIDVIKDSSRNYYFHRLWDLTSDKIRDGYQLSEAIQMSQDEDLIASGIIQMLRAGEKSGKLDEVSRRISVFYDKKMETSIKSMMVLIEPLMITIIGAVIGTIAIALLLPVFKISSVIAQ
jgi:type IV pilus assembly protein PilC